MLKTRRIWVFGASISLAACVAVVFLTGDLAMATPSLQTGLLARYPFIRETQVDSCTTCHMPVKADFLNAYGLALRNAEMKFEEVENLDSDGDGVSNLDEMKNETFPGSLATSPEYYIFHVGFSDDDPNLGAVHFNHEMHVIGESFLSNGKCNSCHGKRLLPKVFDDRESIRTVAHQVCWRCHETSGSKLAPKDCAGCHAGIQGMVEEIKQRLQVVK